jgi:outer membrane protein OmpA-like peptidoglycan-associated protein
VRELPRPDRWRELTALLVGTERERLTRVEQRLDHPDLALDAVADALPEAVRRRSNDDALGDALAPVVGEAIKVSVRRDPQPVVDAIFPVIGPAIRRAISSAFGELVQSINTTLEHSFSPRGIGWRIEAMRTGKSFGEVVLSHSLLFRVEQVFLIHRNTGLLVTHLTSPGVKALPPEMVAGMLTAIGDFARDTFEMSVQEGLDSFALGDLTVWVEQGPGCVLAAVIRGHAPVALRETLQQAVEGVQRNHAADLDSFASTGAAFDVRQGILESCLVTQVAQPSRRAGRWRIALIGAVILFAIAWFTVPRILESRRFSNAIATLRNEPGVVVGSTGRSDGRLVITGLRDPLARDPALVLAGAGLDTTRVSSHWEPYIALRPEFVLRRAGSTLRPPSTVQLVMHHDTLAATGIASSTWLANAARLGVAVSGVSAVDFSAVQDSADVALRALADRAERYIVSFGLGQSFPRGEFRAVVDSMSAALRDILDGAAASGRSVAVEARATTDTVGTEATNASLRLDRARVLRALLLDRGLPAGAITPSPDPTPGTRAASLRIAIRPSMPNSQ